MGSAPVGAMWVEYYNISCIRLVTAGLENRFENDY